MSKTSPTLFLLVRLLVWSSIRYLVLVESFSMHRQQKSIVLTRQLAKNNNSENDMTSIQKPKQYVPDGLTLEEYQRIREKEENERLKMNFGAFGPRFAQSARPPQGDWMLMRRLWTDGSVDRPTQFSDDKGENKGSIVVAIKMIILNYSAAFALSSFLVASISGFVQLLYHTTNRSLKKVLIAKAILSVLMITPLLDRFYLDPMNRFRLWSKRRTAMVTTGAVTILLLLLRAGKTILIG